MIADRDARWWRRRCEALLGVPATDGNRVEVLRNGDRIFPAMLDAIGGASRSIELLTFIYWSGDIGTRFARSLSDRAGAVRVRVLLDAVGCRPIDKDLVAMMEDAGCDVRWFRPVNGVDLGEVNHRTHRKILVCDETVGFTGGVGIADLWQGDARDENEWRDTHFRVVGPAVDGLRAAFLDNWSETGSDPVDDGVDQFPDHDRSGPSPVMVVRGASETGASDVLTMLRTLLGLAGERVRIATAYFNPDDDLLELFAATAARGVAVEILVPGPHADKRFVQLCGERSYQRLLDAGVTVWCYQPSMLHAKICTVDRLVASVGSANINQRSTQYDEEVNLLVFDPDVVAELDDHFDDDLRRSSQIDSSEWRERGLVQRVAEKAVDAVRGVI